jgi:UDP-N-acetyl-D-galactosamine dehydrogenase
MKTEELRIEAKVEALPEAIAFAVGTLTDDCPMRERMHIELVTEEEVREADCIVILAAHDCYRRRSLQELRKLYKKDCKAPVLIDVRNIYSRKEAEKLGFVYWSL